MGLDLLLAIWVVTWVFKTAATDIAHAVKGTPNPRYELKRERALKAGQPVKAQPRYGTKDYAADFMADFLKAKTEKRREMAKAKAQPVDDMIGLTREPKPRTERVYDPNNSRNCPQCKGEVVLDGRPCPRCLAEQERRNAEWEALGGLDQIRGARRSEGEPEWLTPTPDETEFLSRGRQLCPACRVVLLDELSDGSTRCPHCNPDTRPDAQIIQFPNPKNIEKEITMANTEATGLSTAIAFAEAAASAHQSFATAGAEGYIGALQQGGMDGEPVDTGREAMEASGIAADKWNAHKATLEAQLSVKEAYQGQPGAADKEYLLNG